MPEVDAASLAGADEDLALLRDAAREAGVIALRYFGKNPEVWMKGGTSPVSEADYAADTYLRNTLLAARPDYGWLSEETADGPERLTARRVFVVDPIDGTRGFLDGLKFWCVSVAVVEDGKPIAGVLECPAAHETYWATPGGGAFFNGERIKVRNTPAIMASISPLPAASAPWLTFSLPKAGVVPWLSISRPPASRRMSSAAAISQSWAFGLTKVASRLPFAIIASRYAREGI